MSSSTLALSLGLAGIFGTLAAGLIGVWSAHLLERKRQVFQREQDARAERARVMQSARILDSALLEAEGLASSAVKGGTLWVDLLAVPDGAVWPELRGSVAHILEPSGWFAVNMGFMALGHMRGFEAEYRKLGYDHTSEATPKIQESFRPILHHLRAAREALHPVAYPDHIRLPDGHPMLALLAEQRAANASPAGSEPSAAADGHVPGQVERGSDSPPAN
jgi:hypothetical protein